MEGTGEAPFEDWSISISQLDQAQPCFTAVISNRLHEDNDTDTQALTYTCTETVPHKWLSGWYRSLLPQLCPHFWEVAARQREWDRGKERREIRRTKEQMGSGSGGGDGELWHFTFTTNEDYFFPLMHFMAIQTQFHFGLESYSTYDNVYLRANNIIRRLHGNDNCIKREERMKKTGERQREHINNTGGCCGCCHHKEETILIGQ